MQKLTEKSFNENGYRIMRTIAFGDCAQKLSASFTVGSVIMLLNPKAMKANGKHDLAFNIDMSTYALKIGYSEDFD